MNHGITKTENINGRLDHYLRSPYRLEFFNAGGKKVKTMTTTRCWLVTSIIKGITEHAHGWIRVNDIDIYENMPNTINIFKTQKGSVTEYVTV